MARLRVIDPKGYIHYWNPVGVHTHYPAGFEGTVKRDVLLGAIKAGAGEDMDVAATAEPEAPRVRRKKADVE